MSAELPVRPGARDDVLQRLLAVFVDTARADVAVLRLREDDRLLSRASVGLEEEVSVGFSLPIEEGFAANAAKHASADISSVAPDAPSRSEFIRKKGVGSLYRLSLVQGSEFVGVLELGMLGNRPLSDEARHLLVALATPAALAISRYLACEVLEQAVRSRDEVLSVVAHDLRNPLNVISIAANTLLQRLPDSSARRPIERIIRGAHRADRIVQDLLEISAFETGQFSIDTRSVEPADLILAALESQHGPAAEASVILATDIAPDLPQVVADEERMLEVLENLIGNAVKFTRQGGSISVGARRQEKELLVWVKDTGSGIAPEQLPHIFDRFWQAKKKERRGTGLGLTICKAIVEAHSGRIWAESAVGVGTSMFFTIPAAATPPQRAQATSVANILLVDDRPENLLSLKAVLERPEYRLVTAASGEEALRLALREHFAVALIDVAMPEMSGLELAVRIKELGPGRDFPIVFITAYGEDPELIRRAYAAGGADYLVKPLDAEIVRKKVAVFVELNRRRQGNESRRGDRASATSSESRPWVRSG